MRHNLWRLQAQLSTEDVERRKPFDRGAFVWFFKVGMVSEGPNLHTDTLLCSVTTGPRTRRPIPEQWLAYVWALCSSTPTQKAGGQSSHEGQVVSSGISPRLSHSSGDRCKRLHLHARPHNSSKGEAVSNLCAAQQKRPGTFCLLLSAVVVLLKEQSPGTAFQQEVVSRYSWGSLCI